MRLSQHEVNQIIQPRRNSGPGDTILLEEMTILANKACQYKFMQIQL